MALGDEFRPEYSTDRRDETPMNQGRIQSIERSFVQAIECQLWNRSLSRLVYIEHGVGQPSAIGPLRRDVMGGRNFLGEFEQRVLARDPALRREGVSDRDSQGDRARVGTRPVARRVLHHARSTRSQATRAMDRRRRRCGPRRIAATQIHRHARRRDGAARLAQGAARTVERPRGHASES